MPSPFSGFATTLACIVVIGAFVGAVVSGAPPVSVGDLDRRGAAVGQK